ncbi:MAG: hypothetical protein LAT62_01295 [Natronospirillum sp.]|nr:inositol monophosphatase family protein [Natronospirillum sp.]MCH8550538.1 hypothetical protein [Natronospirillum sp.]
MHPTLTIALRAAHAAAEKLVYTREHWSRLIEESPQEDIMAQLYPGASRRVHNTLRKSHPDQALECTREGRYEPEKPQEDVSWQTDILLGETNFRRGLGECGVLVSQWQKQRMEHLTLVFPFMNLEVIASRGRGMQINGRRVRTANQSKLSGVFMATDLVSAEPCSRLLTAGAELRVSGCALLDLVRTAAGQLDLALHHDLPPLEYAATQLLATEAGAVTGDISGAPLDSRSKSVVCANPKLFKATITLLRQA